MHVLPWMFDAQTSRIYLHELCMSFNKLHSKATLTYNELLE